MPVKIKSSGGGSVSFDVPNTGTDYTLTMPANNATLFTTAGGTITGNVAFTSNNVTIAGQNIAPSYGSKNKIINGDFRIWQRSTAPTPGGVASWTYNSADRWLFLSGGTSATITRSTSVPTGFQYSLKLQRTASTSGTNTLYALQIIESLNCVDLQGQNVTFSFWAKAGANFSASGNSISVGLQTGTVADEGSGYIGGLTGMTVPLNTSTTITTTWTRYSFTVAIPSNALEINCYIYYNPTGTAGSDDALYITGVQLEAGSTVTPFEFRQIGTELALCQRYYFQLTASGASQGMLAQGYLYATTQWEGIVTFPVDMRTIPTVTFTSPSTFSLRPSGVVPSSINYYTATGPGTRQMLIYTAHSAFGSAGLMQSLAQVTPGLTGIYFSAEL